MSRGLYYFWGDAQGGVGENVRFDYMVGQSLSHGYAATAPFTQGSLCERAMTEVLRLKGLPSVSLWPTLLTQPNPSVAARHLPTLWGVTPLGEPTGRRGRRTLRPNI